jgi:REP element-mobilizing transposase RayT
MSRSQATYEAQTDWQKKGKNFPKKLAPGRAMRYYLVMRLNNGTIRHRRHSIDLPGHAHELTFCTYKGYKLLSKDRTRQWFIDALSRARTKHDLLLLAWVLMPDHVHLLLLPNRDEYLISDALKSIKQPVGRRAMNFLKKNNQEWLERLTARAGGKDAETSRSPWTPLPHCISEDSGHVQKGIDSPIRQVKSALRMPVRLRPC